MLILQDNWDVISLEINCEKWSGQCLFKQICGKKSKYVDSKFYKADKYQKQIKSFALLIARPVNREHRYKR